MTFAIKDFFSKCDHIRKKLRIWSQLLKKSLMENFIFCRVLGCTNADFKISLYVRVNLKMIPWKNRILNPYNARVVYS